MEIYQLYEVVKTINFSSIMWQIATPLIFSLADIITGYIQALINNNVDSQKMRVGLLHKMLIVTIIILSFVIEFAFKIKYIAQIVCVYVVLMEGVSILENLKKAGIDIGKFGDILKEKTDKTTSESVNELIDTINTEIRKEDEK